MIKKISAIILALVLCLSVMVVPASAAAELNGTQVAYALEWDKEYYNPGDTATLYLYLAVQDDIPLYTGTITVGLNSQFISIDDNDPASCIAAGELCESYYKDLTANTVQSNATYQGKIEAQNTAEENATYDWYIRTSLNKNTGGSHANANNNKDGLYGSEIDPTVPFITYTFTVSADAPEGSVIPAAITSGCAKITPIATAQLAFKYYTKPGTGTTTANIAAAQFDVSNAVATASVGKPAAHECTPAEAVQENVVAATCGTDGSYDAVVYCSGCGEEISRTPTTVPATGEHVYAKELNRVEPTCTEDGYVILACGCSDNENITEKLDATGHDETKAITRPTCTEGGYTTYTCKTCGNVRTADETPAKGHDYREKVTAPTCTEAGYTTFTCPFCKDSYTGNPVEATGHNYESVVTAPTCTVDGYTTYTCSVCDDTYTADIVPATGHTYEVSFVKNPTCSKPGYTEYKCSCGDTYKEEIPSKNHTNEDGSSALVEIPAVPATCKNHGYTAGQKCSICNTQTIVPERVEAIDHTWDDGVVTAPTYTSEGYTKYICTVCGETKIGDKVPALTPDTPDTPDVPDTPDTPETAAKFAIKQPAVTKLRYMDEMLLHTVMPSDAPEGAFVKWTVVEGEEYFTIMEDNGDGKLRITPREEGWTTFRATLYDAGGNVLATDEIEMFSRAHLFDKIGGIIRYIFGSNIKYEM